MIWLTILLALRLLSLKPALIDDDEAWFSVSARALHHPFRFYQLTPDNKPPGTVWFYWLFGGDPQVTRAAVIVLLFGCALGAGWLSRKNWKVSGVFFCVSALFPKLSAVTNESIVLILVTTALGVWFSALRKMRSPHWALSLLSGASLAGALLTKQTSFVYIFPVMHALFVLRRREKKLSAQSLCLFLAGLIVPLAVAILELGVHDFFYWNFTYARDVLQPARNGLFSEGKELAISLLILAAGTWPLWKIVLRRSASDRSVRFLYLWLLCSLAAALAGWGLFLHYFIPIAAPLALLYGLDPGEMRREALKERRFAFSYVVAVFSASSVFIALPYATAFFGTDLFYYQHLADRVQKLATPDQRVFFWSGSAIPAALSRRMEFSRFPTARFVIGPYATSNFSSEFQRTLEAAPPDLFVDLHLKRDNRFRTSPYAVPWLSTILLTQYEHLATSLPWVSFYRLKESTTSPASTPNEEPDFSETAPRLDQAVTRAHETPPSELIRFFLREDPLLRSQMSLELLSKNAPSPEYSKELFDLKRESENPSVNQQALSSEISDFLSRHGLENPLPLQGPSWWVSYALTRLQP